MTLCWDRNAYIMEPDFTAYQPPVKQHLTAHAFDTPLQQLVHSRLHMLRYALLPTTHTADPVCRQAISQIRWYIYTDDTKERATDCMHTLYVS